MKNTFKQDVEFLNRYTDTVVLGNPEKSAIVLAPKYQGRVMTSTAGGRQQDSFGWINYELIENQVKLPQINLWGGEERFWLAPEGGRYSIYFPPAEIDQPLEFSDWRVPECIDTGAFEVSEIGDDFVSFQQKATLPNRMGTAFSIGFDRTVRLLGHEQICETLNCDAADLSGLNWVAHQSENRLINRGEQAWIPETGLLSVWVLCMNSPSPNATLIAPYRTGSEAELGPIVNADYFGKLGRDRLLVDETKSLVFLKGDGQFRSKLGLTYPRACPLMGAWDEERKVLTVVWFNLPAIDQLPAQDTGPNEADGLVRKDDRICYVNNLWQVDDDEYNGDVMNGYNDGPNESGAKLGGFFELESLSPALALKPGQSYTHVHRTIRIQAESDKDLQQLDQLAKQVFGVSIDQIRDVFGR